MATFSLSLNDSVEVPEGQHIIDLSLAAVNGNVLVKVGYNEADLLDFPNVDLERPRPYYYKLGSYTLEDENGFVLQDGFLNYQDQVIATDVGGFVQSAGQIPAPVLGLPGMSFSGQQEQRLVTDIFGFSTGGLITLSDVFYTAGSNVPFSGQIDPPTNVRVDLKALKKALSWPQWGTTQIGLFTKRPCLVACTEVPFTVYY